jgi:hypothetical protein
MFVSMRMVVEEVEDDETLPGWLSAVFSWLTLNTDETELTRARDEISFASSVSVELWCSLRLSLQCDEMFV